MTKTVINECYRMPGTAATHAISTLGKNIDLVEDQAPIVLDYAGERVEICTTSKTAVRLGITSKKLLDYILLLTTCDNPDNWPDGKVYFTLKDYMRIMGYENTRTTRHQCFAAICEDIEKLGTIRLKLESGNWFGLVEDRCRFVSYNSTEHSKKDVLGGHACFEISVQPELLEHIKQDGSDIPLMPALFDRTHKNENAYAVMKRMLWHFSTDGSPDKQYRLKVKKFRLKVSMLLACCPDRSNQRTGGIRQTFEKALNHLASDKEDAGPLIQWNYIHRSKHYTTAEISAMRLPHKNWLNALVAFKLIGLPPKMVFTDPSDLNAASQTVLVDKYAYMEEYSEEYMQEDVDFPQLFSY